MASVTVVPAHKRSDFRKFLNLTIHLYRDDRNWVEPLRMELVKQFDTRRNPFFNHGTVQPFIALRENQIVGRITAIQDTHYNKFYGDRTGFFGFFDCVNDPAVAAALLSQAEIWSRERGGDKVVGPLNFTMFDGISPGILISGFDSPPFILMSHAPPYYSKLIEKAGYEKELDVLAFRMPVQQEMEKRIAGLAKRAERTKNIRVRYFDPKNFWRDVEILKDIFNSAWEKNWGFVPFTDEDFNDIVKSLKKIYIKELVQIAEIKGVPVGWAMTLPNINEALIHLKGRIFPFGIFKLLYWSRNIKSLRLWGLGIKPQYRKLGVDAVLYYHTLLEGKRLGYTDGELSWVMETNLSIINAARLVRGQEYKRYRVYGKKL
jgi:hypothetical protein